MTSLGFTGTRLGPSPKQIIQVENWLIEFMPTEVHHGDCMGCDEWFHKTVRQPVIHVHPPRKAKYRAYCEGDVMHEPDTYLRRNQKIVDASDVLIAVPYTAREVRRSGTWSTVRMAEKKEIPIYIAYPNGNIEVR